MSPRREILGKTFGLLTAVEELRPINGMRRWRLQCNCGGHRVTLQKNFVYGNMRSCGCDKKHKNTPHKLSKTPEYRAWINMKSRCYNESGPQFGDYGGRGIKVCARWIDSVEDFCEDMGQRPSGIHSVDRIDVNGDYEPANCRWATGTEQSRNQRSNHIVDVDGILMTLAEAVERSPVPYNTVLYRLKRGWPVKEAVSRVARKGVRHDAS